MMQDFPKLAEAWAMARSLWYMPKKDLVHFCPADCWYGMGNYYGKGVKQVVVRSVGFEAEGRVVNEYKTPGAYELAYDAIADAMPPCYSEDCDLGEPFPGGSRRCGYGGAVHRDFPYIYFMDNGSGQVKIGTTTGPVGSRKADLQTGSAQRLNVLGVMPGTKLNEKGLHEAFRRLQVSGEWFTAASPLMNYIYLRSVPEDRLIAVSDRPTRYLPIPGDLWE